ncbi:hypothetical protein DFH08DRAFT_965130 [Mycena albidolilacea]|uniref:Uncharacterized protein n=1 Tax=Mycena albidolilacea TaxID=1033008 RepID=A0AAD6ZSW0_9AGAR|nr:hypothetical protein DFH08DRAFT_965130 [Mycena albidolilacea]
MARTYLEPGTGSHFSGTATVIEAIDLSPLEIPNQKELFAATDPRECVCCGRPAVKKVILKRRRVVWIEALMLTGLSAIVTTFVTMKDNFIWVAPYNIMPGRESIASLHTQSQF